MLNFCFRKDLWRPFLPYYCYLALTCCPHLHPQSEFRVAYRSKVTKFLNHLEEEAKKSDSPIHEDEKHVHIFSAWQVVALECPPSIPHSDTSLATRCRPSPPLSKFHLFILSLPPFVTGWSCSRTRSTPGQSPRAGAQYVAGRNEASLDDAAVARGLDLGISGASFCNGHSHSEVRAVVGSWVGLPDYDERNHGASGLCRCPTTASCLSRLLAPCLCVPFGVAKL